VRPSREVGAVLSALIVAAVVVHCGGSTPGPTDVALYSSEKAVCVANATSYDAGEACLNAVRSTRCGPGGLWIEAGVCDGGAP
jgi:hypothetical protein